MVAHQKSRWGWFFTVTAFIACPCHLPLTLGLLAGIMGGAAGAFLRQNLPAILGLATLYFLGALLTGLNLLGSKGGGK